MGYSTDVTGSLYSDLSSTLVSRWPAIQYTVVLVLDCWPSSVLGKTLRRTWGLRLIAGTISICIVIPLCFTPWVICEEPQPNTTLNPAHRPQPNPLNQKPNPLSIWSYTQATTLLNVWHALETFAHGCLGFIQWPAVQAMYFAQASIISNTPYQWSILVLSKVNACTVAQVYCKICLKSAGLHEVGLVLRCLNASALMV